MNLLTRDLRYAIRMLLKQPGFTLIALVSLAFGIGANTAIFSLVNTALLRPLPISEPEQFISLNNRSANRIFATFSYPNYKDLRDRNETFAGLLAYRFAPLSLSYDGMNERLWGYIVSGNYFETLGVKAALGRLLSTNDDRDVGAHPVTVISYKCWQERFGGNPNVIEKTAFVNGRSYAIIGVAPQGFYGTEVIAAPDMWFPMAMQPQIEMGNNWLDERDTENLFVQGRIKSGVSLAQAQAALNAIALELEREFPDINQGRRITLATPGLMGGIMRGSVVGFTGLLMVVVGLVLLLACTNLANLLLARATERHKEIALRLALGASRFQLVRQLLMESLLLGVGGGLMGLLLASWLVDLAVTYKPPMDVPLLIDLHIDYRVLIFTCLLSLVTGVLFGLLPALQATKTDLVSALKDEISTAIYRRSWLKNSLIVLQVALSLVLLIGGGLMLRALERAQTLDLGFNPNNAIEMSYDLRLQGYEGAQGREFQNRLLERVRALPGVEAAAIASLVPVDLHFSRRSVYIEGQAGERSGDVPRAMYTYVSPDYFAAMETRLIRGRDFNELDNEAAMRVAIVNETFARQFWPGQEAIGKRFSMGDLNAPKMQIIGVAQDGKYAGLNEDPKPFVYEPIFQTSIGSSTLVVRTTGEPEKLLATIRNEIQQLDPTLPIASAKTLVEHMSFPLLPARLAASVLGSFGLLALALASIGIYGVMAYSVNRRVREIGIRLALGAQKADVLKMIIGQGMRLIVVGVAIGLTAALALTRLMTSFLYGASSTDPLTFVVVVLLLSLVALLACYIPARRATKVDPMVALRYE
jgi:macrolide transport system ATP-binding/permease protein